MILDMDIDSIIKLVNLHTPIKTDINGLVDTFLSLMLDKSDICIRVGYSLKVIKIIFGLGWPCPYVAPPLFIDIHIVFVLSIICI